MRTVSPVFVFVASATFLAAAPARAQSVYVAPIAGVPTMHSVEVLESHPLDRITPVPNAPFSADAVTEFNQLFADGNRIERRFVSSMARDSRGRTRRAQEVALLGPLATAGNPPRLVTITDPVARTHVTLDEKLQVARQTRTGAPAMAAAGARLEIHTMVEKATVVSPFNGLVSAESLTHAEPIVTDVKVERLGRRQIEGVNAEGTRVTTTIPAGAIGNQLPIDVVTERWISDELQMPVLITRRDPRSGETVYRLANIIRSEPAPDLFAIPASYTIVPAKAFHYVGEVKKTAAPKK